MALTGMDGLNLFDQEHFNIVAVDLDLPDMDGVDACLELLRRNPDLPVIIVIDRGNEAIAAEALNMGVAYYLVKTPT